MRSTSLLLCLLATGPLVLRAQGAETSRPGIGILGGSFSVTLDSATIAASPSRTLAEVLSGRVAGINVTNSTGAPGFAPEVSARGSATTFGSGRPLLYVDGVLLREDRFLLGQPPDRHRTAQAWNLPTEEIAAVEVVMGPAGGTLLPFGASRGAVFVRTKRGGPGAWRTTSFVEATAQTVQALPRTRTIRAGTIAGGVTEFCPRTDAATGFCTPTTSSVLSPFGGADPFRASAGVRAGVSAAGDVRIGTVRVGTSFDRSPSAVASNTFDRVDLSAVLASRAWRGLSTTLSARYARTDGRYARWGAEGLLALGATAVQPGDTDFPLASRVADSIIARALPSSTDRLSASLDLRWAARDWLSLYAVSSAEKVNRRTELNEATYTVSPADQFSSWERTGTSYKEGSSTATVGARATRSLPFGVRVTGEIGGHASLLDLHERLYLSSTDQGGPFAGNEFSLFPDVRSTAFFAAARLQWGAHRWVGGGFRKESTRLFEQTFGDDPFNTLQLGWALSDERFFPALPGVDRLALRAAYGESGDHEATLELHRNATAFGSGPGRMPPRLQRTLERDIGADLSLLGGRALLRGTAFVRALRDGYMNTNAAFPSPPITYGSWVTHGHEWALTLPSRGRGALRINTTLSLASARTRVTELAGATASANLFGGARARFEAGARFGALYAARHYFNDANGDGVIDATEITIGAATVAGVTTPSDLLGLTLDVAWRQWLRAGVTLDGKSGQVKYDGTQRAACQALVCDALYAPGASLTAQARAVVSGYSNTFTGPIHAASFIRARELWLRVALAPLASALRMREAAVTLTLRNALLTSRYPAGDPETGSFVYGTVQRGDYFTPALPRHLSLRLDLVP